MMELFVVYTEVGSVDLWRLGEQTEDFAAEMAEKLPNAIIFALIGD